MSLMLLGLTFNCGGWRPFLVSFGSFLLWSFLHPCFLAMVQPHTLVSSFIVSFSTHCMQNCLRSLTTFLLDDSSLFFVLTMDNFMNFAVATLALLSFDLLSSQSFTFFRIIVC